MVIFVAGFNCFAANKFRNSILFGYEGNIFSKGV